MTEQLPFISKTSSLPLLSSMCRVRRGENFRLREQAVTRPMLCLVLQGEGLLVLNDKVHTAQANHLFFLERGTTIEAASRTPMECILLSMNTVRLKQVRGEWHMLPHPEFPLHWPTGRLRVRHESQSVQRFIRLHEAYHGTRQQEHCISVHSQLHELLQHLSEHRLEDNLEKVDLSLERSIAYMQRYMSEGISMEQLAKMAGLTASSYSRSFKKAKGMSPTDYLNRMRIDEAKRLLSQDKQTIKDVAESVGYGNEYYFSRKFKQSFGMAPSLYMKRRQLKIATVSTSHLQDHLSSLGLEAAAALGVSKEREQGDVDQSRQLIGLLDRLRRTKPDLIIADHNHSFFRDQLKMIAPTVFIDPSLDWKETHWRIAELAGQEERALQNLKQLEFRALDVSKRLRQHFGRERVTVLQITPYCIRIQGGLEHPLNELLYHRLCLQPASLTQPNIHAWVEYTADSIPLLDTDHLLLLRSPEQAGSEKMLRRLKQTAAWNRSPAVLQGSVHEIQDWMRMSRTPSGRQQILNELEQLADRHVALFQAY
ncbi:helix-turn-helix domain-containing protein [Paenibacillus sp. FSL W8-0426]|uniref:helix-turn-helix domain-containing protein n=1 Tax=Paenibacillus sp. FSL W8-0426 TaxID=2921714 RepID=UPI0030DCADE3